MKVGLLILALAAVLAVPFLLRPKGAERLPATQTLIILSPHNEAVKQEFERAFRAWHAKQYGEPASIDWRNVGGTSEIVRFRFTEKSGRMAHYGDPVVDEKGRVIGVVTSCSLDTEGYRSGQAYIEFKYGAEGTPILIFQSASDQPEKAKRGLKAGERVTLPEPAKVLTRFLMKKPIEQEQRGAAA